MANRQKENCSRARLWRVLRHLQSFTTSELALGAGVELTTTRAFVSNLGRAGLVERKKGGYWRLTTDTGPKPPETRRGGVFDVNTGTLYPYVKRRGAKAPKTARASKPPLRWRPGLPGCLPGEGL